MLFLCFSRFYTYSLFVSEKNFKQLGMCIQGFILIRVFSAGEERQAADPEKYKGWPSLPDYKEKNELYKKYFTKMFNFATFP